MNDKKFIGMYYNDSELMSKIDDLKSKGIEGENIYVIAQDDSDVTMFQGMKYGDVQTTPESWFDRFMDFLTDENHVRSMLREVGVADGDMDNYYKEIQNGGKLLYVDEGELNQLHSDNNVSFGVNNVGVDPNLGANRVSEFEENELNRPSAAFQDSNLYEGTEEHFGRVGGEALRNEYDYETPPSNYYGVQNRFNETDHFDRSIQEAKMRRQAEDTETVDRISKKEKAQLENSHEVEVQDEFIDEPTMRKKWNDDQY